MVKFGYLAAASACLLTAGAALGDTAGEATKRPASPRATATSVANDSALLTQWDEAEQGYAKRLARLMQLKTEATANGNAKQIAEIDALLRRLAEQRLLQHRLTHEQLSPSGRAMLGNWMAVKQMGDKAPAAQRVQLQLQEERRAQRERDVVVREASMNAPAHHAASSPVRAQMVARNTRPGSSDDVILHACVNSEMNASADRSRVVPASECIEAHRASLQERDSQRLSAAHAMLSDGPALKTQAGPSRTVAKQDSPAAKESMTAAATPATPRTARQQELREELRSLDEDLAALEAAIGRAQATERKSANADS